VAGAAGFIGSHLCARLLDEGYDVVGVDNFLTGRRRNLDGLRSDLHFDFRERDVIEPLPALGRFEWVFNLASPASPPAYQRHSLACLRVNSEGTLRLLQLALESRGKFFLASTSEVYGDPNVHPQKESYWGNVNPIGPRSVYDEAKRYAESITSDFHRVHELPVRIVRIFNTYGPHMDPEDGRVVSNFLCQALSREPLTIYGDGKHTRSFQYVDDLVEGVIRLMRVDYNAPVNLGNPEEVSVAELAEMIAALVPGMVEIVYHPLPSDDPRMRRPDSTLARELLQWSPRVSLGEGLRKTLAYFERELVRPRRVVTLGVASTGANPRRLEG
jgi:dTDP-glucose 4,6-dehydratase